jgi:hypothetical protein
VHGVRACAFQLTVQLLQRDCHALLVSG